MCRLHSTETFCLKQRAVHQLSPAFYAAKAAQPQIYWFSRETLIHILKTQTENPRSATWGNRTRTPFFVFVFICSGRALPSAEAEAGSLPCRAAVHPLICAKPRLWCWEVFYNHMQARVGKHSAMHQDCRLLLRAIRSRLRWDSCISTPQLACPEGTNVSLSRFTARN